MTAIVVMLLIAVMIWLGCLTYFVISRIEGLNRKNKEVGSWIFKHDIDLVHIDPKLSRDIERAFETKAIVSIPKRSVGARKKESEEGRMPKLEKEIKDFKFKSLSH
jgi:hypothetical protein